MAWSHRVKTSEYRDRITANMVPVLASRHGRWFVRYGQAVRCRGLKAEDCRSPHE